MARYPCEADLGGVGKYQVYSLVAGEFGVPNRLDSPFFCVIAKLRACGRPHWRLTLVENRNFVWYVENLKEAFDSAHAVPCAGKPHRIRCSVSGYSSQRLYNHYRYGEMAEWSKAHAC